MTTYNVFCDSCSAEYSVTPLAGLDNTPPTNCAYCGSTITEEAISEKDEEWTDEDWDKLIDDEWSSEDDR
jgi:DNA-directed RNA polymerase subunit RPC12/RpoP